VTLGVRLCVCPPSRDCTPSAAKVMCCIQFSLVYYRDSCCQPGIKYDILGGGLRCIECYLVLLLQFHTLFIFVLINDSYSSHYSYQLWSLKWSLHRRFRTKWFSSEWVNTYIFVGPGRRVPKSHSSCSVLVVVASSIQIPKAFLIRIGAQRNFAYTFVLTFIIYINRLRLFTYFLINEHLAS